MEEAKGILIVANPAGKKFNVSIFRDDGSLAKRFLDVDRIDLPRGAQYPRDIPKELRGIPTSIGPGVVLCRVKVDGRLTVLDCSRSEPPTKELIEARKRVLEML